MVNTITNSFIIITVFFIFVGNAAAAEAVESLQAQTVKSKSLRKKRKAIEVVEIPDQQIVSLGASIWGEKILLQTGDGREENVAVEYTGVVLGLDYIFRWESIGLSFAIDTHFMNGQAQSEENTIVYKNKVDKVLPVFGWVGVRVYPHSKVVVGMNMGALYHSIKLEPPSSVVTYYDFKYANNIQAAAQLHLGWMLSDQWLFQQEIFMVQDIQAKSGWNVSLGYIF